MATHADGETITAIIEKDNDAANEQNPDTDLDNIELIKLIKVNNIENGRNIIANENMAHIPKIEPNTPDKTPEDEFL